MGHMGVQVELALGAEATVGTVELRQHPALQLQVPVQRGRVRVDLLALPAGVRPTGFDGRSGQVVQPEICEKSGESAEVGYSSGAGSNIQNKRGSTEPGVQRGRSVLDLWDLSF